MVVSESTNQKTVRRKENKTMTNADMISVKTDIALIKKDIQQIEHVFKKVDDAIGQMTEILQTIAVQEKILENNEKRINSLEEKIIRHSEIEADFRKEVSAKLEDMRNHAQVERERRHKEVLKSIEDMNKSLGEKLNRQDKRIQDLENWRWYILGIGAVIVFILNQVSWTSFFN